MRSTQIAWVAGRPTSITWALQTNHINKLHTNLKFRKKILTGWLELSFSATNKLFIVVLYFTYTVFTKLQIIIS